MESAPEDSLEISRGSRLFYGLPHSSRAAKCKGRRNRPASGNGPTSPTPGFWAKYDLPSPGYHFLFTIVKTRLSNSLSIRVRARTRCIWPATIAIVGATKATATSKVLRLKRTCSRSTIIECATQAPTCATLVIAHVQFDDRLHCTTGSSSHDPATFSKRIGSVNVVLVWVLVSGPGPTFDIISMTLGECCRAQGRVVADGDIVDL